MEKLSAVDRALKTTYHVAIIRYGASEGETRHMDGPNDLHDDEVRRCWSFYDGMILWHMTGPRKKPKATVVATAVDWPRLVHGLGGNIF